MTNKPEINEFTVSGKKIPYTYQEIDIWTLEFWKENPRVSASIKEMYGERELSNDDIDKALWKRGSVKDLKKDIEKQGGLIDEILIRGTIVLEGNSRLCAFRHLFKEAEERNDEDGMLKWSYIKAKILPPDTSDEIIFAILGTWHIKGKTPWEAYEKAAYLKKMQTQYKLTDKEIADKISQPEKFVKDNIKALELMRENDIKKLEKFSYCFETVKNKRINELSKKDESILPGIFQAIKDDRFSKAEQIRDVPKVIKDKKAFKEFFVEKCDFAEALDTTKERHVEYKDSFFNQMKKMTKLLDTCSINDIESISQSGDKTMIVKKFYRATNSFYKKTGIKSDHN